MEGSDITNDGKINPFSTNLGYSLLHMGDPVVYGASNITGGFIEEDGTKSKLDIDHTYNSFDYPLTSEIMVNNETMNYTYQYECK